MTADGKTSVQFLRLSKLIYLVEGDVGQGSMLAAQIGYFGYTVLSFTSSAELKDAFMQAVPAVLLMDLAFSEHERGAVDAVVELRETFAEMPPVFFISSDHDAPARIQAVRAGGDAYFTKPVNIGAIIETLDRMILDPSPEPFRILIIDDSQIQALMNAYPLQRSGMQVSIVTEPMQVMQTLEQANPELILLDMYMQDCTGMEIAKMIRQMDAFLSTPIVFLSLETNRTKQLEAVGLGGDDFLVKPIRPEFLVAAVTSRVERYRRLRKLMYCDSLTGLLNHAALKDSIDREVNRSSQQGGILSFVMIDLDHFKSVNDCFGHTTGDRVLKNLSQILTRRLRKIDIIGRYGGEEFGIILPFADSATAVRIMNELREDFSRIRHQSGGAEFSITFSCGIASYPTHLSADELCSASDRALYTAKQQGRNCVVVYADQIRHAGS